MLATDPMLRLPNALIKRGAKVDVLDGWGNRGVAGLPMAPKIYGLMVHWIVSTKNGKPKQTLGVVANGHSKLAGPLANLHQDWDGTFTIVAGGRANHGGLGVWRGVSGNQFWIAVECEGPPFEQVQIDELAKLVAAVADVTGQNPEDWAIDHSRYAPNRKIDCKIYMDEIREKGIALYRGTPPTEPKPEKPSGNKPAPVVPPVKEPEQEEEPDMILAFDARFGVNWVVKPDLSSKTASVEKDRETLLKAWKELGLKVVGIPLDSKTLDAIPTAVAVPLVGPKV